jgi:hypothetical protein
MFYRVVCEVMGIDHDDLLLKALDGNGVVSIHDLLALTNYQIDAMSFDDGTGVWFSPSLASRNKIRVLRSWHCHLQLVQGRRIVDWMDPSTVNEDEWDDYRVGVYVPTQAAAGPISRVKKVPPAAFRSNPVQAPTPVVVVPASGPSFQPIEEAVLCLPGDGVSVDGELDTDEAIVFGSNDLAPGTETGDVFMLTVDDAMMVDLNKPLEDAPGTNDVSIRGSCDFVVDCCGDGFASSTQVIRILKTDCEVGLCGVNGSTFTSEPAVHHITTGVASAFVGSCETNVVFDPGGGARDVFEWDEFFGCDWFTPAPEQYLNLLLLDRGE